MGLTRGDFYALGRADTHKVGLVHGFVAIDINALAVVVAPVQIAGLNVMPVREDDAIPVQIIGLAQHHAVGCDPRQYLPLGLHTDAGHERGGQYGGHDERMIHTKRRHGASFRG